MWTSNQAKIMHVWEAEKAGRNKFRRKSLTIFMDSSKEYKQMSFLSRHTNIRNWREKEFFLNCAFTTK